MRNARVILVTLITSLTLSAFAETKNIVFLAGAASHGYGAHEHYAGCKLLAERLNESGLDIHAIVHRGWPDDLAVLDKADAVVIFSDGGQKNIVRGHEKALDTLAKEGLGIGFLHYATIPPSKAENTYFHDWIGGCYELNWSVNPHWLARFDKLPGHPITRGVRPFAIEDEWYYHMRFRKNMENVTPILTAIPPDATRQRKDGPHSNNPHVRARMGMEEHVAWAYDRRGGGRGFGFTGAHWHWNWANDNFRKLMLNALVWIAGLEPPADGVASQTPSLQELTANLDSPKPAKWGEDQLREKIKRWNATPYKVVSIPDFLNVDTDYPQQGWEEALAYVLDAIKAENPDFVLVAGDLVMGHWHLGDQGIDHWAQRYYTAWKQRMKAHELPWYAAIGDHEVGDDAWPPDKAKLVPQFKNAFRKHLAMPLNGPEHMKGTAYYFLHKNVLFVSLDVFETNHPGDVGYVEEKRKLGGYEAKVTGEQLQWLETVLKTHPNVAHTIVMGHTPILTPVRQWSSSGLTLLGGEDSEVWRLMKEHNVDLYLCGEVHDITCKEDGGIQHIAHGGLFGYNNKVNYLVMTIAPERIELELKRLDIVLDGQKLWQTGNNRPQEVVRITPEAKEQGFQTVGTMSIDKTTETKILTDKTGLFTPEANTNEKIKQDNQRNRAYSKRRRELGLR